MHQDSIEALNKWYYKTKKATWKNLAELKNTFRTVDYIGEDRYVFNIAGNHYRLVGLIHFSVHTLYIRAILTHEEYNYLNKSKRLINL